MFNKNMEAAVSLSRWRGQIETSIQWSMTG